MGVCASDCWYDDESVRCEEMKLYKRSLKKTFVCSAFLLITFLGLVFLPMKSFQPALNNVIQSGELLEQIASTEPKSADVLDPIYYNMDLSHESWMLASGPTPEFSGWVPVINDADVNEYDAFTNFGWLDYATLDPNLSLDSSSPYDFEEKKIWTYFATAQLPYLFEASNDGFSKARYYCWYKSSLDFRFHIVSSPAFNEMDITWNAQPITPSTIDTLPKLGSYWARDVISGQYDPGNGWNEFTFSTPSTDNSFCMWAPLHTPPIDPYSSKYGLNFYSCDTTIVNPYPPSLYFSAHKFYQTPATSSTPHVYIQTDITEVLALRSPIFSPLLDVRQTNTISVSFNARTTHPISFNLLHGGTVVDTFTLTSGNQNGALQTKEFILTNANQIDQLEFTGTFDAGQYLQVNDLTISGDHMSPMLSVQSPGPAFAARVLGNNTPSLATYVDDTLGGTIYSSGITSVTATLNGQTFTLTRYIDPLNPNTHQESWMILLGDAEWQAWGAFWQNPSMPDGSYTIDFCAEDNTMNIGHQYVQIYRMISAYRGDTLYEMNLTSEIWEGTGGTFSQTETELFIQAITSGIFSITSPDSITIASEDEKVHPLDQIMVQYQTTSTGSIFLNLTYGGITQESFDLLTMSTEVQTRVFHISNLQSVDQLVFNGEFSDTQYLRVISVAILRPVTIKPEVNLIHPFASSMTEPREPTFVELTDRIFGSSNSIPSIKVTAYGFNIESVTASINGQYSFPMSASTGEYSLPGDYELSPTTSHWGEWYNFWNAIDTNGDFFRGEGNYTLTITAIDSAEVWPQENGITNVSVPLFRDLTPPAIAVSGILNGTGFAWDSTNKMYPTVTLNASDFIVGNLSTNFLWSVRAIAYTFDSLEGLPNPLEGPLWIPLTFDPIQIPSTPFSATLDGVDIDDDGLKENDSWAEFDQGEYNVTFGILDYGGQVAFKLFRIIKDCTKPDIRINTPMIGDDFTSGSPSFALQIVENYLITVQYAIGTSPTVWYDIPILPGTSEVQGQWIITTLSGQIDASCWTNLIATSPEINDVEIKFQAIDCAGQVSNQSTFVDVDAQAPQMLLRDPALGEEVGAEAPMYLFEYLRDANLKAVYYTLSGSLAKYPIALDSLSGLIDQDAWDRARNHTVVITFYAVDDFGNMAITETTVTRTDYTGPAEDESPGFHNFFNTSWEEWTVLGAIGAVMFLALFIYHRRDQARVPKVPQEALIRAQRRQ